MQQARGRKVSQRAIPRLAVRQPAELEQALLGLQGVLRELGPKEVINSVYVNELLEKLPRKNPYHTKALELTKTLRLLGLMDDSRLPTSIMIGVWGRSTAPRNAVGSLAYAKTAEAGQAARFHGQSARRAKPVEQQTFSRVAATRSAARRRSAIRSFHGWAVSPWHEIPALAA